MRKGQFAKAVRGAVLSLSGWLDQIRFYIFLFGPRVSAVGQIGVTSSKSVIASSIDQA